MIRRFIKRVLDKVGDKVVGRAPRRPDPARGITVRKVWPAADLGLSRAAISSAAMKTCEGLREAGHQAYIVGGGVRDSLLGLRPKDFDVATDAPPEVVQKVFRRARIIGRRFQIVHVVFGREIIETSTFRALQTDAQTDEHGRVLRDNVFGTQQEDAMRRDFTVNALYYDPVDEIVVDFLGGVEDLRARRLRMIGDPATRYREDPVRMLRTIRFASKLGFEVDPATLAPIRSMAPLLENVPGARLFDEILKLLQSGHAAECVRRLRAEGLHHGVLPLLDASVADEAGKRFVTLALEQTDRRVNTGKSVSPSFLFATLLWHQVLARWEEGKARGELPIPALHQAIDTVLDRQGEKLAIQRRYQSDMREIWIMQPRLERRGRPAWRLLEHLRFRAGYDFLLLRCDAGELPTELGQWWTDFIDGDTAKRDRLLQQAAEGGALPARKRRKRRKPKAATEAGQADGATGDGQTGESAADGPDGDTADGDDADGVSGDADGTDDDGGRDDADSRPAEDPDPGDVSPIERPPAAARRTRRPRADMPAAPMRVEPGPVMAEQSPDSAPPRRPPAERPVPSKPAAPGSRAPAVRADDRGDSIHGDDRDDRDDRESDGTDDRESHGADDGPRRQARPSSGRRAPIARAPAGRAGAGADTAAVANAAALPQRKASAGTIDPAHPADPSDPSDPSDPAGPTGLTDSTDSTDSTGLTGATGSSDSTAPAEPTRRPARTRRSSAAASGASGSTDPGAEPGARAPRRRRPPAAAATGSAMPPDEASPAPASADDADLDGDLDSNPDVDGPDDGPATDPAARPRRRRSRSRRPAAAGGGNGTGDPGAGAIDADGDVADPGPAPPPAR